MAPTTEQLTESGPEIRESLRRAHDASVVEFTYTKPNGDVSQRRLVVQDLGQARVLGWDLDAKAVRSFTIAGITELLTASPPEIDLAPLAAAMVAADAVADDDEYEVELAALIAVKDAARPLVGGIIIVPVEEGEEPTL